MYLSGISVGIMSETEDRHRWTRACCSVCVLLSGISVGIMSETDTVRLGTAAVYVCYCLVFLLV